MPSNYKKGFNNHSVYIPPFIFPEVPGVTFGGFEIDKYPNSQPSTVNEAGTAWYDVAHSGAPGHFPGVSKPGVPVWDFINFPQAMIACCNKGKGWHLTSAFEGASIAFLSQKNGTMPRGNNRNVNPPSTISISSEIGLLDKHLKAESSTSNRALPGSGPNTWSHNHMNSGVFDINGLVWEWTLMMMQAITGYPYVPANLDVSYTGSPYGRGTISGSGGATPTLTCDGAGINWLKAWTVNAFNTNCFCYIAEGGGMITALNATPTAGGSGYIVGDDLIITTGGVGAMCRVKTVDGSGAVTAVDLITGGGGYTTGAGKATSNSISGPGTGCTVNITTVNSAGGGALYPIDDNAATTLTLANTAAPPNGTATFSVFRLIPTDITINPMTGLSMTSGHKISTLRNSDVNLGPFAIPASSDSVGSIVYGNDGYWFSKTAERVALRGGSFTSELGGGVFALNLLNLVSTSDASIGFRACKAL